MDKIPYNQNTLNNEDNALYHDFILCVIDVTDVYLLQEMKSWQSLSLEICLTQCTAHFACMRPFMTTVLRLKFVTFWRWSLDAPERVKLGSLLAPIAREAGKSTNIEAEHFNQLRDKTPAEPMRFECSSLTST